ncbi:MAG: bifunctional hydroxymethylpyrimidine kinase/phosphomethylpyrimidine kinase [Chloroflexi bacterium]|nr:bifunctional hydroxymethylpyrimidine kinase/phosphomethylpyrimidine kinase [Chloroflexota bacterium]
MTTQKSRNLPPRVLSIGGSDSGGSAGIQADLKTYEAHGVFGTTALTVVTAQNTIGVHQIFALPVEFIQAQIDAVLIDIGTYSVKTGLLGRAEVVGLVTEKIGAYGPVPLVVDPVLVNGRGDLIVSPETLKAYREQLFPLATVITPNLDEAARLVGLSVESIHTPADLHELARQLKALGPQVVVVKGGHLQGDHIIDLVFDGRQFIELDAPRLPIENPHGVGCTFASAIAANLAKGISAEQSVRLAHTYLQLALQAALEWQVGAGRTPVNHHAGTVTADIVGLDQS